MLVTLIFNFYSFKISNIIIFISLILSLFILLHIFNFHVLKLMHKNYNVKMIFNLMLTII